MVDATVLTTFYSFTIAVLIFLATRFLDKMEKVRDFLVKNSDKWENDKEMFENLKGGLYGKLIMLIPIITGILLNAYLLIITVFSNWKTIGLMNYLLISAILLSILFTFAETIINTIVIIYAGYEGDPDKYLNWGKKRK